MGKGTSLSLSESVFVLRNAVRICGDLWLRNLRAERALPHLADLADLQAQREFQVVMRSGEILSLANCGALRGRPRSTGLVSDRCFGTVVSLSCWQRQEMRSVPGACAPLDRPAVDALSAVVIVGRGPTASSPASALSRTVRSFVARQCALPGASLDEHEHGRHA